MTSVARGREHSGDYSDVSHQEIDPDISNDGGANESDYDSQGSDSDGSERDPDDQQETEKRVDDDEDRSNPQYIPKRGTFYEHDDRTAASGEESTNTTSETASEKKEGGDATSDRRRAPRKSETINKWSHDKFNANEQMPKSRDELVSIYGYDIRNEDAPPHARRNRRYGRGPNKYTRTWEDEEAYRRATQAQPPRKVPTAEDFPELDAAKNGRRRPIRPRSKSQPSSAESADSASLRRNESVRARQPRPRPDRRDRERERDRDRDRDRDRNGNNNRTPKPAPPKKEFVKEKLPQIENLTITASVFNNSQPSGRRVSAAVAQQRPVPTEQGKKKPPVQSTPTQQPTGPPSRSPPRQPGPNAANAANATNAANAANAAHAAPQPTGPEPRGSKRYSSLRQRPLDTYSQQAQPPQQGQKGPQQAPPQGPAQQGPPQTQGPQTQNQHRYHAAEYGPGGQPTLPAAAPPPLHPQQLLQQQLRGAAPHGPSPPHALPPPPQHPQQQVRLGLIEQPPLVHGHHAMHNLPQHTMVPGQMPPAQGYAPPAMMPAQYMQQSGSGAVYGGTPIYAQPPQPYPHPPIYPHHNYATQAGGVTYYSCSEQEQPARPTRRPTQAIPIVRPALPQQAGDRAANSTEKDNIDRIVENMFVRKPWPASHGAESKEKPSESRSSAEPPSKESSQPNSLTSSSISTDSKPSEVKETKEEIRDEVVKEQEVKEVREVTSEVSEEPQPPKSEVEVTQESITTDA